MSLIPFWVWLLGGSLLAGGVLLWLLIKSARREGASDEKLKQSGEVNEALRRAGDVQNEHRTVDDTTERLRRGDF